MRKAVRHQLRGQTHSKGAFGSLCYPNRNVSLILQMQGRNMIRGNENLRSYIAMAIKLLINALIGKVKSYFKRTITRLIRSELCAMLKSLRFRRNMLTFPINAKARYCGSGPHLARRPGPSAQRGIGGDEESRAKGSA